MPYPAVYLVSQIGGQLYQGSGVLISPDEVLTSAHLVYSSTYGAATKVLAVPAYDGGSTAPYGSASAISLSYWMINDPNFSIPLNEVRYDYAVVHLASPFNIGSVGFQTNFSGGSVSISGYPASQNGVMATTQAWLSSNASYESLNGATGISPGSSGSPAWITGSDANPYVVGLASGSDGVTDYFTQITTQVFSTIESWVIRDDGAPTPMPNNIGCSGGHDRYLIAANPTNSYGIVADTAGIEGQQNVPNLHQMIFTDGTGRFDPTGNAEEAARLYQAALNRMADAVGLDYWTAQLDSHSLGLSDVALGFISSNEFNQQYGGLDNRGFVEQLYQNVLHRPGEASGVQYWTDQLAAGVSKANVLVGFSDSMENKANTSATIGDKDRAEAYRLYQAAFNRTPDADGLNYWTSQLDRGMTPIQAAQGFVQATEFSQIFAGLSTEDFVRQLYQNVLHRAPDAGGEQYWIAQLDAGASQAEVLLGFADSIENRLGTAPMTHDNWVFLPSS